MMEWVCKDICSPFFSLVTNDDTNLAQEFCQILFHPNIKHVKHHWNVSSSRSGKSHKLANRARRQAVLGVNCIEERAVVRIRPPRFRVSRFCCTINAEVATQSVISLVVLEKSSERW